MPAMNALAWYYEHFEQDYDQAVALWEKADVLNSSDAALNLGVLYSQGLYPGQSADQVSSAPLCIKYAGTAGVSAYHKRRIICLCDTVHGLQVLSEGGGTRTHQRSNSTR